MDLESLRNKIPITRSYVYLDNAGAGPLPLPTVESIHSFLDKWSKEGEPWENGLRTIMGLKDKVAMLLNTRASDLATIPNATTALNAIIATLVMELHRSKRGDIKVIMDSYGFPTNYYTLLQLKKKGLIGEIVLLKGLHSDEKVAELEEAIDRRTGFVMVDHVSWRTGIAVDLRNVSKIVHDYGAFLVTDAFHSVGSIKVDVSNQGPDFLYFGSYKWLMAPHGAGFLYVSSRVWDYIEPLYLGWMGVKDGVLDRIAGGEELFERELPLWDFEAPLSSNSFEWGTPSFVSFVGLSSSLSFMEKFGWQRIFERVTSLARVVREILGDIALEVRSSEESGIVIIRLQDPLTVAARLRKHRKIIVSARPGFLRISPHFYNTEGEVEEASHAIREEVKGPK